MKNISLLLKTISILFLVLCFNSSYSQNKKNKVPDYEVTVEYLDGKKETFESDLHFDSDNERPYVFRASCEEVIPSQTKSILLKDKQGNEYTGVTENDKWYYLIDTGIKASLYGKSPGENNFKNYAFKIGSQPMIDYSYKITKTLFSDNPAAYHHIKKHRRLRVISKVLLFGGLAMMASPFLFPDSKNENGDGIGIDKEVIKGIPVRGLIFGAGILTSFSYLLFKKPQKVQLQKAVEVYNY